MRGATPAGDHEYMIKVNQLTKCYGRKQVIADVSFQVPDSAITGFLGPNGAGKSTTMRCMLGLDRPTSGSVVFQGKGYAGEFSSFANKPRVASALLDPSWFTPARSGRNHLLAIARGAGVPDKRVDECLEYVGLQSAAKQKASSYSLGMKQRLGIAAALLGDPQHLILDEPMNGLDPEGVNWMRTTLRNLADEGRSILVSSHILAEMEQLVDRLVVIGGGKLIGEYSLQEFLADGTFIRVETEQAQLLAEKLKALGMAVFVESNQLLQVGVDANTDELELRTLIANVAVQERIVVFGLQTVQQHLEQRFLAVTKGAQQYRTSSFQQAMNQGLQQGLEGK